MRRVHLRLNRFLDPQFRTYFALWAGFVGFVVFVTVVLLTAGCGGDARMEMAAADALMTVAEQMEVTVDEYHQEVGQADDGREAKVIAAFVTRVRTASASAPADDAVVDQHATEFATALAGIRADRETEWDRRNAALENVGVLREIAKGMRRLAVESLTLDDELRRYATSWIETRSRAGKEK